MIDVVNLALPATHKHLADRAYSDKLKAALELVTGRRWLLVFEVGDATPVSLAARERRERDETRERSEAAFREEPFVRDLVERFDGKVRSDSIKPLLGSESNFGGADNRTVQSKFDSDPNRSRP